MSTAAVVVLAVITLLVITLNVAFVCETWEKVTKMEIGELPGREHFEKMINELKDQKLTETGDYSNYFNEGLNLAIDIAERYEKDF